MQANHIDTSGKALFRMTWPIFVELLMNLLVGNMDQIQLSHFNATAVAAVGNANQVINVVILMFNVISLASMILISQYRGAQDLRSTNQIYVLSLCVNFVLSILLCGALLLWGDNLFTLMQVPTELLGEANAYLTIAAFSLPFQALMLTFSCFLRAGAHMRVIMWITGLVNVCNILGNAVLINGFGFFPRMGAAGAALSSAIFRGLGLVLMALAFLRSTPEAQLTLSALRPFPKNLLRRLLAIGLPSGGENLSYNLSQMMTLTFINAMGTYVVTTRMYSNMFATCIYMLVVAVSQSGQILVGYLVGARRLDEAYTCTMNILKRFVPINIGLSLLMFLCAGPVFGLFSADPRVIALGKTILFLEIFLEIGRAFNIVLVRNLQAVGDVRFPVAVGICSQWIIAVGVGYVLGVVLGWGLAGIWVAFVLDENVRGAIFLARWMRGKWRSMKTI